MGTWLVVICKYCEFGEPLEGKYPPGVWDQGGGSIMFPEPEPVISDQFGTFFKSVTRCDLRNALDWKHTG